MGNEPSTQKKGTVPVYNKVIDKTKLEIVLKKIFFTTQLQRDRKKGLIAQKEKELLNLIAQPKVQRNKDSESAKASAIVSDIKTVKAQDAVMRYCDIVKDRAMVIEQSKGDPSKINDLLPYIESIVWGSKNLNLECIKDLETFLHGAFGPEVYGHLSKGANVTPDLRECFDSVLPSEKEIKKYLVEFCKKNSIEIELMNEIGHNISETLLMDIPDNSTQGTGGNNNCCQGGGYPSGGYPGGGYPSGGYPGGGGGTTMQVDPNKGITITIGTNNAYPNQFQQQSYQQQNYQPQQYQQPTYQQPTYQQQQPYQPTYQQQQPYGQPTYQQPTTQQQPTFTQQNTQQQPTFTQPTYQQPTIQQQQPYQDPKYQPQPYQPQFTGTTGGNQTPTTTTPTTKTTDVKPQPMDFGTGGDSSYPTFKKMQIDPYPGGPKNDLDDFQARLKNIKDGL